jgi:hypothetical protein
VVLAIALVGWAMGGEWLSIRAHVNESHLLDAIGGCRFCWPGSWHSTAGQEISSAR